MANPDLSLKYDLGNELTVQFSLKIGDADQKDFMLVQLTSPGMTDEQIDELFEIDAFKVALEHFEGEHMQILKAQYPERYKALAQ